MSARTRSSTRIQPIQPTNDDDIEIQDDETSVNEFNLEEKEQEIWDETRDEHYEAIEQLPLTLHRQFALLRQLEKQSNDYSGGLLPTIRQYVELRKKLHNYTESFPSNDVSSTGGALPRTQGIDTISPAPSNVTLGETATSRELLKHIASLSEEYLRTSHEKVNLAQTAQDSVERQIRRLDQFIKEQEASLSAEPNAPVLLSMSELVVPKWSRAARVSMSPMLDDDEDMEMAVNNQPNISGNNISSAPPTSASRKRPPRSRKKEKEKEKEKEKDDQTVMANPRNPPSSTIQAQGPELNELMIDPNEPTWCYCNRVSFGEMIGCDDPGCKYEWFHLECVGLKEVPEDDEWYCRECTQKREARKRK